MNSADTDGGSFPITKEVRQSCKKAHQRQNPAHKAKTQCRTDLKVVGNCATWSNKKNSKKNFL